MTGYGDDAGYDPRGSYADLAGGRTPGRRASADGGPLHARPRTPAAGEDYDDYDETYDDGYADDGYGDDGYADDGYPDQRYAVDPGGRRPGSGRAHGRRRPPPQRRRPLRSLLLGIVLVVVLVVAGLGWHLEREINPSGGQGSKVSVAIPTGASSAEIGSVLARAGVIHGSSLFRYYVKLKGAGPLLPGTYQLPRNESYDSVIAALSAGPPQVYARLVIPEGFTLAQIAARVGALPGLGLSAGKFLAAASSGQVRSPYEPTGVDNLEGLVFPATYEIKQGSTETDVLQTLVQHFDDNATALGLVKGAAALGMTPYQVVTVASIVEREAKLTGDRGPVASAIYNRLKVGMPLGADSTLVYALRRTDPSVNVSTIDYNQPNPYNTRLNKGLPPSPIANPGLPSLMAAITPPTTTYLYFVETNPDGQLSFASTSSGFAGLQAQCRAAKLC